jgi:hypothetical protein
MRGFFPLCHRFFSFWHYGIAGQHMTTAIGGGFLSLNKIRVERHTLCWENGVDFTPEYLYDQINNHAAERGPPVRHGMLFS